MASKATSRRIERVERLDEVATPTAEIHDRPRTRSSWSSDRGTSACPCLSGPRDAAISWSGSTRTRSACRHWPAVARSSTTCPMQSSEKRWKAGTTGRLSMPKIAPSSTSLSSRSRRRWPTARPTCPLSGRPQQRSGDQCRVGSLVVLESTTYPGTTEEVVLPILEQGSGLVAGVDFHLGYSPERIDPGNAEYGFSELPKVVSGVDIVSLKAVDNFYSRLVTTTVPVSSPKVAELSKLLENTFRHVNIALVNELAMFAGTSASTSGKLSTRRRQSRSDSCASTRAQVWGDIAFRSTRATCRGR